MDAPARLEVEVQPVAEEQLAALREEIRQIDRRVNRRYYVVLWSAPAALLGFLFWLSSTFRFETGGPLVGWICASVAGTLSLFVARRLQRRHVGRLRSRIAALDVAQRRELLAELNYQAKRGAHSRLKPLASQLCREASELTPATRPEGSGAEVSGVEQG